MTKLWQTLLRATKVTLSLIAVASLALEVGIVAISLREESVLTLPLIMLCPCNLPRKRL